MKKILIPSLALAALSCSVYAQVSPVAPVTNFNVPQLQIQTNPQTSLGLGSLENQLGLENQAVPTLAAVQQAATPGSSVRTKTASEQGLAAKISKEEEEYFISRKASQTSARQMGVRVYPGREGNPFIKAASSKEFHNWKLMLRKAGVPQKKVLFEAKRLNKKDFAVWATKQIKFRNKIEVVQ